MATYYVDPSSGTNGSGSFGSPFNVWTSAWSAAGAGSSDILLQKAGTTFVGTVGFTRNGASADAPIIVGVYDPVTGARMTGVRGAAKINGNGASIGMNMQDRYFNVVDGFEVFNCLNYGLYEGHSAGTADQKADYVTAMQFTNLYVHHIAEPTLSGMWIQGSGVRYSNILIEDCAGDGISHAGQATYEDLNIRRINNTEGGLGDCIQQQTVRSGTVMRRCRLDHSNNPQKQAYVLGTGVLITATGIIIEDNEFIGDAQGAGLVSVNFVTGVTVRRNKFYGAGLYVLGSTSVVDVDSNIFIGRGGNTIGIGSAVNATVNARHNTIIEHQRGVELLGVNNTAKNNIVYFPGAELPINAISKTTNFTNLDGDPLLDDDFRPDNFACKGTGTYVAVRDYRGRMFRQAPNIGAIEEPSTTTRYLIPRH